MTAPIIPLSGKLLGSGHRPLIIAEMSANHNGSLDTALQIVRAAAESGADAIKLQTYTPETLTLDSHRPEFFIPEGDSLWQGRRLWDLYREAYTPWEWHEPIFTEARRANLACISTAYDPTSVDFLLSLGVEAIKIASFELIHIPLIERAARSRRPVFVSTGMATLPELDEAVAALRDNGCHEFVLLKCTSAYPSDERDANVMAMADMRDRYDCHTGLSDHTLQPYAAFAATGLGAVAIEKHFTLSRSLGGTDAPFSIEPQELRELAHGTALVQRSLGEVCYRPLEAEASSLWERPSIFVSAAMKQGDVFTDQNIRVIRPAHGLAPRFFTSLIGKQCSRDVAAGSPLTWDLIVGAAQPC